jgi:KaiC/GvpD/RAD55 family RecA-like ATPase
MPTESATILVRGGPGAGKSVLATDTALRMARALGGDVLYVCIEILPSEVIAQRMGFDGFDPTTVLDLANGEAHKVSTTDPTLVVGMTPMDMGPPEERGVPDLGQMILDLLRISHERGCKPLVVVVDSLTDGYNLGASVPREIVDGVCKLAVEQGWVLVLVEETVNDDASPWCFAVDTVISLKVTEAGRREARVMKHRFGACQPGPHRLLVEREGVRVIPCFAAYRNAVRDLALPVPAQNRSLRVPVLGGALDWTTFDVPNGQGEVIIVETDAAMNESAAEDYTAAIGVMTQAGSAHPGARATLVLSESHTTNFDLSHTGLRVGTLHQMIDGDEWLEAALSHLNDIKSPLTRVRIGPTNRLVVYEHGETLRKAISLLATILSRRGIVVVVFGVQASDVIRAGITGEVWTTTPVVTPASKHLKINRSSSGGDVVEFEMAWS